MSKNGGMNMDKKLKRMFAVCLAVCLTICSVFSSGEWQSSAAKKKVKLEKKLVNVYVGNTVKIKLKNNKKKTKWTVISGKKNVSLSKKKKDSVMVKAKKTGKAKVQAKVGRKKYIATVRVFEKKQEKQQTKAPTVTPQITPNNTQQVMPTKEAPQTTLPTQRPTRVPTATPTVEPTATSTSETVATPTVEPTVTPTNIPTATPINESTATPIATPVNSILVNDRKINIDESKTYPITMSELNETTFTSASKREDGQTVTESTTYNKDGSVSFCSSANYDSGVSFYINPITSEDQIIDISDTRGEGFYGYDDGAKDVSEYDYIRMNVTSENELYFRTYNGNDQLRTSDFPGTASSEMNEKQMIEVLDDSDTTIWDDEFKYSNGYTAKEKYVTRTVFIPIYQLIKKGMTTEYLTAIAVSSMGYGAKVTIHSIDFVKAYYDKKVTSLEVTTKKDSIDAGATTRVFATITPDDATRQIVKWSSSDEDIATVNSAGIVTAKKYRRGEVVITAKSTDGSDVEASITIAVGFATLNPEFLRKIPTENGVLTVDESKTYPITISELNETTFTSAYKRSDGEQITKKTRFFADGSVAFTSSRDFNSGVSFYINPVTNEDQIIDVSDTRGEGFFGYDNGTKDVSEYDYIRIVVTSQNELNFRTYNGNEELRTADFPGRPTSETYEGAWIHTPTDSIWEDASPFSAGNKAKAEYETRVVYIPMQTLIWKGANPETLTAIAICPQASDVEVTIHNIDFVKVKCDKLVTGIDVESYKTELEAGKSRTLSAVVTPADASRQIVKWTSDNEDIATVNFQGVVTAKKGVEGTVTITAEATDGSGVTGSIQMTVRDPDKVIEVKTHKFDLASDNITAKTTSVSSGGTVVEAGKSALGIEFIPGEALKLCRFLCIS